MYQYKQLMVVVVAVVAIRASLWWCEAYGPLCLVRWLCRSMCEMPTMSLCDLLFESVQESGSQGAQEGVWDNANGT